MLEKRKEYQKIIRDIKTNAYCKDCNKQYPYYVLDFDHIKDKKFTIGHFYKASSKEKLLEEISKCELVCSNCHRIRTHNRKHKCTRNGTVFETVSA